MLSAFLKKRVSRIDPFEILEYVRDMFSYHNEFVIFSHSLSSKKYKPAFPSSNINKKTFFADNEFVHTYSRITEASIKSKNNQFFEKSTMVSTFKSVKMLKNRDNIL